MKENDIVHLFVYLMIFIVLSNWYINFTIISILGIINLIIWFIFMKLVLKNRNLKKENKKLKSEIKND